MKHHNQKFFNYTLLIFYTAETFKFFESLANIGFKPDMENQKVYLITLKVLLFTF